MFVYLFIHVFLSQIYVPPPDAESRSQILRIELKRMPTSFTLPPYKQKTEKVSEKSPVFKTFDEKPSESGFDLDQKLKVFSFTEIVTAKSNEHSVEGKEGEKEDVKSALQAANCNFTGDDLLDDLIMRTSGFSGAEMVAVVQEAGMLAIDEGKDALDPSHLYRAISGITPQITASMLRFYQNIAKGP